MEKLYVLFKMYMTSKMYSHLLIYIQLRFFNLFANCLFVEAWSLLLLSTTVSSKFEKPIGRNWPLLLVKTSAFLLDSQGSG